MPLPKVQIKCTTETLTIYINGYVHLYLVGDFKGLQSWVESFTEKKFCIDFYIDERTITAQYENKQLWLKILKELEKKVVKVKLLK